MKTMEAQFNVTFESVRACSKMPTRLILKDLTETVLNAILAVNPRTKLAESKLDEYDESGKILPKTLKGGLMPLDIPIEHKGAHYKSGGKGFILGPNTTLYRLIDVQKTT